MEVMTVFGGCLIGFGFAVWLVVFIAVGMACKGINKHPDKTPPPILSTEVLGGMKIQEPQTDIKNLSAVRSLMPGLFKVYLAPNKT